MVNKLRSIFLLLIIIAPYFSTGLWYNYRKNVIRKEVKAMIIKGIDLDELMKIEFSPAEIENIQWKRRGEFILNGKFYDIVDSSDISGSKVNYCWLDREETELNNKVLDIALGIFHNDERTDQILKMLDSLLNGLFFQEHDLSNLIPTLNRSSINYYLFQIITNHISPDSPPPND